MTKLDLMMKWIYTFVLLAVTIGWAAFTVLIVNRSLNNPDPGAVIEASGTSLVTGALIVLNTNVNQHWFRKKTPDG